MQKLSTQSKDLSQENIKKIEELFPNCVTETYDEKGNLIRSIDFDILRQDLSDHIVEGPKERYQFNWPGKREAILLANAPTTNTLRPLPEKSVDFENTKNVYIEGDNLEALKIIRETYMGKVDMIYIDPPYNTGGDLIYKDDFKKTITDYLNDSKSIDEDGNHLIVNNESNGRFHSDWLNLMFPRITLARDVLKDNGLIFISIDENEVENLKRVCNLVFGEESFVCTLHVQMSTTQGMKVKAAKEGNIVKNAEYILCYSKDGHKNIAIELLYDLRDKYDEHYTLLLHDDGTIGQISELYDYKFPKDCNNTSPYSLADAYRYSAEFAQIVRSHLAQIVRSDKVTGFDISAGLKNGYWKKVCRDGKEYLLTLDLKGNIRQLLRLSDSWGHTDGYYGEEGLRKVRGDWWSGFYIDMGNVSKEGNVTFKSGKKPVRLIKQLVKIGCPKNGIVLDFFSGSGTTAAAVFAQNEEDGGKREFFLIQIPQIIDEPGFEGKTICDLAEQRIKNTAKQFSDLGPLISKNSDYGFRTFFVDSSNMKDIQSTPQNTQLSLLQEADSAIKPDRT
ncbi:MAG: site-specific DNA-methyltransferase, partial [Bacilli bacterium]|nr:site-specific DNA-methyltransferase [Bacilli bacterium]